MKHLKTFESFEDNIPIAKFELEENQVDDLHEQFDRFIEDWEIQNWIPLKTLSFSMVK